MGTPYTFECSCGLSSTGREFVSLHFAAGHRVRVSGGEGYPVVRRFVIRRHPFGTTVSRPWILRDRSRPAYLGHYATRELAVAAVYRKVGEERGIPTRREIREAMTPRETVPEALARAKAYNNPGEHNHAYGEDNYGCPVCTHAVHA